MSFINTLKNGEIPQNNRKTKRVTPYDAYMAKKRIGTLGGTRQATQIRPKNLSDAESIILAIKRGNGVIADFSGLKPVATQRLLDYISGAVFALDGKIEKTAVNRFLITPCGMNIISEEA